MSVAIAGVRQEPQVPYWFTRVFRPTLNFEDAAESPHQPLTPKLDQQPGAIPNRSGTRRGKESFHVRNPKQRIPDWGSWASLSDAMHVPHLEAAVHRHRELRPLPGKRGPGSRAPGRCLQQESTRDLKTIFNFCYLESS